MRLAVTVVRCFISARCGGVSSRFTIARFLPTAFCCFTRPLTEASSVGVPAAPTAFVTRPVALLTAFAAFLFTEDGNSLPVVPAGAR